MDKGSIKEQGTHAELLALNGGGRARPARVPFGSLSVHTDYARLWRLQTEVAIDLPSEGKTAIESRLAKEA